MANYPARSDGSQATAYLRAPVTFALGYTGVKQVGTLPAGALVLRTYVVVTTAFNAGSTNTLKIGTVASDASFSTTTTISTAGVIAGTSALATSTTAAPAADTPVIATMISTGTAPTAGAGVVVVEYLPVA